MGPEMNARDLIPLVWEQVKSRPKDWVYSGLGIVFSVGLINLALGVGLGLQVNVIEHALPLDTIEVEPSTGLASGKEAPSKGFTEEDLTAFEGIQGVSNVFPKQKAMFKARMWGGEGLLGKRLYAEAFFDGVQSALVQGDLDRVRQQTVPEGVLERKIPCVSDEECFGGSRCDSGVCQSTKWNHPCHGCDRVRKKHNIGFIGSLHE